MAMLDELYQYDLRILLWCRKSRFYPQFISLVRVISKTGDGYLQLLVPMCYLFLDFEQGKPFLGIIAMAFAIERLLYFMLKNVLKRRRPPEVVPDFTSIICAADQFSFPSGHTMAAFLLAGLCLLSFGVIAVPLYLWAVCIAMSRVILGVHFPSDTIAGAVLGTSIALVMTALY